MTPGSKDILAEIIMSALITILILLIAGSLLGCAVTPKPAPTVSTVALTGRLDRINAGLSRVDGKSVVIESWLKSHEP
jgi:hypothetical protein